MGHDPWDKQLEYWDDLHLELLQLEVHSTMVEAFVTSAPRHLKDSCLTGYAYIPMMTLVIQTTPCTLIEKSSI